LVPEPDGIVVTRMLLRGDPAHEIAEAARSHNAGLIIMATHGYWTLCRLLLGSVTAKVLHETQCPVLTGAHLEESESREFSIRRVLELSFQAQCFPAGAELSKSFRESIAFCAAASCSRS